MEKGGEEPKQVTNNSVFSHCLIQIQSRLSYGLANAKNLGE